MGRKGADVCGRYSHSPSRGDARRANRSKGREARYPNRKGRGAELPLAGETATANQPAPERTLRTLSRTREDCHKTKND
jgi:hypothetical protein